MTLRDKVLALAKANEDFDPLESFALAVMELTLEAAAKECDARDLGGGSYESREAKRCAAAIRAMGK